MLDEPQRGVAPGQAAVFYQKMKSGDYEVLGGGVIEL
jgi:tRNA U34 2-thiouridine synthase MnmA/TrmU